MFLVSMKQGSDFHHYLFEVFIALAVSALLTDSLIHLYPESLNVEPVDNNNRYTSKNYLWKGIIMISTIYFFYFLEFLTLVCPKLFGSKCQHNHNQQRLSEQTVSNNNDKTENTDSNSKQQFSSNSGSTGNKILNFFKMSKIVLMLVIGDFFHNAIDGLVIGTQFAEEWPHGFSKGFMTSIAILCHEIPHEIGDFATMLASGLSIKKSIILNCITTCFSLIGGLVGCGIGTAVNTTWIKPVISGIFIYISLVLLMPNLVKNLEKSKSFWKYFVCHTLGYFIGATILITIAFHEDKFTPHQH